MPRAVVVGGGAAGMSAASRVRRLQPSQEVVVLEATSLVSHAPCGIPYFLEGVFSDPSLFMTYTPEFFRSKRNIDVRTGAAVLEADLSARKLWYAQDGFRQVLEYDALIVATGARPVAPQIEGISGDRVFFVHHPAKAQFVKNQLSGASRIVIVGGGVLGVELAEAFSASGRKTILVHRGPYVMSRALDESMGRELTQRMVEAGIDLLLGREVIEVRDGGRTLVTSEGTLETDATVMAVGITPSVPFELPKGKTGAVKTDQFMRTGIPGVYAAGDVAESLNLITGQPDWQPYAPVANKMGFVAGSNVAGSEMRFPGVVGTLITKFRDTYVGKTGLNVKEAERFGFEPASAFIRAPVRAHYFPSLGEVLVELVGDQRSGRVLGGQVMGNVEVLGRLDFLAGLIAKGASVQDVFFSEMGYMPAIAGVWDPVIIAARQLLKA